LKNNEKICGKVETQNFASLHLVGAIHELPLRVFRCNVYRLRNRGLQPSGGHPPAPFDKGELGHPPAPFDKGEFAPGWCRHI